MTSEALTASLVIEVVTTNHAEQQATNTHMSNFKTREEFVAARDARDRPLPMPKLILHALQININAGRLPEPEANGTPSGQNFNDTNSLDMMAERESA